MLRVLSGGGQCVGEAIRAGGHPDTDAWAAVAAGIEIALGTPAISVRARAHLERMHDTTTHLVASL